MTKVAAGTLARSPTRKVSTRATPAAPKPTAARVLTGNFREAFEADPIERVRAVKQGVSAQWVDEMSRLMEIPKERLVVTLGLARATVDRKAREGKPLSRDDSSRVLGMARLVGQVQAIVEESGTPAGFDSAKWVAHWLEQPLPALGGRCPAEFMDTSEGQAIVAQLVARMQSGAYA
jgi:putative toxin-antitoxin system antitoxin component (TIGR02293 family)